MGFWLLSGPTREVALNGGDMIGDRGSGSILGPCPAILLSYLKEGGVG